MTTIIIFIIIWIWLGFGTKSCFRFCPLSVLHARVKCGFVYRKSNNNNSSDRNNNNNCSNKISANGKDAPNNNNHKDHQYKSIIHSYNINNCTIVLAWNNINSVVYLENFNLNWWNKTKTEQWRFLEFFFGVSWHLTPFYGKILLVDNSREISSNGKCYKRWRF